MTAHNIDTENVFAYPSFLLLDQNGDTLAKETVICFVIGQGGQQHTLNVLNPVVFPISENIELWGGFYYNSYCTYPITLALNEALDKTLAFSVYPNPIRTYLRDGNRAGELNHLFFGGKSD